MTFEQILVERDGPVALVTLNRPERLNAWTWQMSAELSEAFADADADDSVRAVVVTGAGRGFCAGADLTGGGGTFAGESEVVGRRREAPAQRRPVHELNTPIIAAINGAAVGAGLTMTMEWDLRVAAEDAKLGFVFNRRGVMPDADLLWLIPRMIGYGAALDVLLTGRIFSGTEAWQLGLVQRVVAAGDVLSCAMELARDIAANTAPASVAITKRVLYEFLTDGDREGARDRQGRLFGWTGRQPDAREGVTAFLQKRPPQWSLSKQVDIDKLAAGS